VDQIIAMTQNEPAQKASKRCSFATSCGGMISADVSTCVTESGEVNQVKMPILIRDSSSWNERRDSFCGSVSAVQLGTPMMFWRAKLMIRWVWGLPRKD